MKINELLVSDSLKKLKSHRQVGGTEPVADQLKHQLVQTILAKNMMRQSNIIKPDKNDIQIAAQHVTTELKRVNYEHEQEVEQALRKQERQRRRS